MNARPRLKKNVPGYIDELGRFRPIRSAKFVGSGRSRRPAKAKDRKKYSRAKAGDLGPLKQERALEAPWDREYRLKQESAAREQRERERIMREIEAETYGDGGSRDRGQTLMQFVRSSGGVRRTFRFGGAKGVGKYGKRASWDSGEIDRLSFKETGRRGLTTDDQRRGKTIDKMYQAAREAGYDVTSMDDMMQRIEDEAGGGSPTYATHGSLSYNPKANPVSRCSCGHANDYHKNGRGQCVACTCSRFRKTNPAAAKANPVSAKERAAFAKFLTIRGYKAAATELRAGADFEKTVKLVYGTEPPAIQAKLRQLLATIKKNPRVKTNPDAVTVFAQAASGLLSAMQINSMLEKKRKKPAARRRKNPVKRSAVSGQRSAKANPAGNWRLSSGGALATKQTAEKYARLHERDSGYRKEYKVRKNRDGDYDLYWRERPAKNPKPKAESRKLKAPIKRNIGGVISRSARKAKLKDETPAMFLMAFGVGSSTDGVYLSDGSALGKKFRTAKEAREYARQKGIKLSKNPVKRLKANPFAAKRSAVSGQRSAKANPAGYTLHAKKGTSTFSPGYAVIHETIKTYAAAMRQQKALRKQGFEVSVRHAEVKNPAKAKGQRSKINPTKPRSRTYEMFQGRKPEKATPFVTSRHAPAKLAQLGDLVEIKLVGQAPIKFNPGRVKLTAANGKLWIAGKRFARPDASQPVHVINPVGEIEHVVYGTRKPHHGDHAYTHYIHELGEESGRRPVLCVDRDGMPVIRGGNYKIEARGIVD